MKRLILSALLCGFAGMSMAQENTSSFGTLQQDADKEVNATADTMILEEELGYSIMEGNVVVIQGGSTLTAEKVRVEYTEDRSEIKHIIATGNVVLLSGEDIAKGDRADYYLLENTVVLTGNAYVKQGTDTMTAQRITMNTITGAAEMTGRVTTVLTPKKDEEGKKSE